jgi:23S rRNA pseudouridine1911/1915/1917 synthase
MGIGGLGQRHAMTEWLVMERFSYGTLLELGLKTGRTHQIRVHMNAIGSPVIGDKTYGDFSGLPLSLQRASEQFGRQALHAKYLGFIHPSSQKEMEFTSEIPEDMSELVRKFSLKMTR